MSLVLLCYKRRTPQKGQRVSCRIRKAAIRRRSEAMEWGSCRPQAGGTAPWLKLRRERWGG